MKDEKSQSSIDIKWGCLRLFTIAKKDKKRRTVMRSERREENDCLTIGRFEFDTSRQ